MALAGAALAPHRGVLPVCMHEPPSRPRMITHGHAKEEWTQVWTGCGKECRARNEEEKEGIVAEGAWWKGRQGEEQEAGDRDRTFGGAKEGREGSVKAEIERRTQEDGRTEEDRRQEEADIEAKVAVRRRRVFSPQQRAKRRRYTQGRDGDAAALGTSAIPDVAGSREDL